MSRVSYRPTFIDGFAGCGGLSLGLMQAGMRGLFAVEKDEFAFRTLHENLVRASAPVRFSWPRWLPKAALSIETLIEAYRDRLLALRGQIDVLAGGPPCQGFSTAGRRRMNDPRNRLFKSYVELVNLVQPRIVLMENVKGFTMSFGGAESVNNYAEKLKRLLSSRYNVHEQLVDLSRFGVPQQRTRYLLIALDPAFGDIDPFELIEAHQATFLRRLGIQAPVGSWAAISDLLVSNGTRPSVDTPGFIEIVPAAPSTSYQRVMRAEGALPTDLRLARHSEEISTRFTEIISLCRAEGRLNTSISTAMRARFNLKKQALRVLDPDRPSPTITSMPDDLLHYEEPRTLTVRENARLQSFPDWFSFHGKYTSGGDRRQHEVPRFTQVANAVPPLAARAIGEVLTSMLQAGRSDGSAKGKSGTRGFKRVSQSLELSTQL